MVIVLRPKAKEFVDVELACAQTLLIAHRLYLLRRSEGKASVKSAKRREILTSDRLRNYLSIVC